MGSLLKQKQKSEEIWTSLIYKTNWRRIKFYANFYNFIFKNLVGQFIFK